MRQDLIQTALKKYSLFQKLAFSRKYLFVTNMGLSFVLSGVGDLLAQHPHTGRGNLPEWDKVRTAEMAATGIPMGSFSHFYYQVLDKRFPGTSTNMVLKKLVIDQVICTPIYILIFFISISVVQGATFEEFFQNTREKWWKMCKADFLYWPVAQAFNFCVVSPKYRVLYDNIASLGSNVYRSYVNFDM